MGPTSVPPWMYLCKRLPTAVSRGLVVLGWVYSRGGFSYPGLSLIVPSALGVCPMDSPVHRWEERSATSLKRRRFLQRRFSRRWDERAIRNSFSLEAPILEGFCDE